MLKSSYLYSNWLKDTLDRFIGFLIGLIKDAGGVISEHSQRNLCLLDGYSKIHLWAVLCNAIIIIEFSFMT